MVEKVGEDMASKVMFRDDPGVSASARARVRTRVQDVGMQVCFLVFVVLVEHSVFWKKTKKTIFIWRSTN